MRKWTTFRFLSNAHQLSATVIFVVHDIILLSFISPSGFETTLPRTRPNSEQSLLLLLYYHCTRSEEILRRRFSTLLPKTVVIVVFFFFLLLCFFLQFPVRTVPRTRLIRNSQQPGTDCNTYNYTNIIGAYIYIYII